MRCRNCHAVLMDSDFACPACRAPAPTGAPDTPASDSGSSGMRILFKLCGGLIGLAIYNLFCGIGGSRQSSGRRPAAIANARASGSSPVRAVFGFLFLLAGVGLLALALIRCWETWQLAGRKARVVTAADLLKAKDPASLPAWWISYTFEQSRPAGVSVARNRAGGSGPVQAPCLLVQVEDKWLIASVAPGFSGNRLVGRLQPLDSAASKDLVRQIRAGQETPVALLPYEFNAIEGCASEHRLRYKQAASVGIVGLPLLLLGLWLVCRRRPAAAREAAVSHDPFAVRALPRG
jgi:hypothetical protein